MKCFSHPQNEAVGSCKYCFRGVCAQCARDSGVGLACSEKCESEVKSVHALLERNKKLSTFVPATHSRSAVMLALMAIVFIGFGMYSRAPFMKAFLAVFGIVMLCGAALAFVNSRKMARAASWGSN
ncbi:MAG TPA: O-antigen ligase family protein [Terriglobales bacterium]|nr:O-antigen ligase family protein [Terriglobales bacterium]